MALTEFSYNWAGCKPGATIPHLAATDHVRKNRKFCRAWPSLRVVYCYPDGRDSVAWQSDKEIIPDLKGNHIVKRLAR